MESILKTVSLEPMFMTYLGIGSCPCVPAEGKKLDPKVDQLIPVCFHEMLIKDKQHMRIIHFDPWFANIQDFLDSYFAEWNLVRMEFEGGTSWVGQNLEVIVVPQKIDHTEDYWFFEAVTDTILHTKGRLVIQEYTGYELQPLNQKLYEACPQKELFKRRILLDMSYGTDLGCCTDMTKLQPFYDYDLNFLNLHFMTDADAKRWTAISLKLDDILKKKYLAQALSTLNTLHVDYRRKAKGDSLLYGSPEYTNDSSPDEIMSVLQRTLLQKSDVLCALGAMSKDSLKALEELFQTYKTQDPYKWYEEVRKCIPRP